MTKGPSLFNSSSKETNEGVVLRVNRRLIEVFTASGEFFSGKTSSQLIDICVGDHVSFEKRSHEIFVGEVLTRKNCLKRLYREDRRLLAANLDHLLIVTAVQPLFQTLFIDRVLAVAYYQSIRCSLVVNKHDSGFGEAAPLIETYRKLGYPILYTSAKQHTGLTDLKNVLAEQCLQCVALTGVSGVGKSSLLNCLLPAEEVKTAAVSDRSGQGRQTTSQAIAYPYRRDDGSNLLLIDLPGIQNFGVGHLEKQEIPLAFLEIAALGGKCEYQDCYHRAELSCAVKRAVESGEIALSRYQSYLKMLEEVESARKY